MTGTIRVADAKTSLRKKGFRCESRPKHDYYILYVDDRKTGIHTFFSRGGHGKEIGVPLLHMIRRQLRLECEKQAQDLLLCPMDGPTYIGHLRAHRHLQ